MKSSQRLLFRSEGLREFASKDIFRKKRPTKGRKFAEKDVIISIEDNGNKKQRAKRIFSSSSFKAPKDCSRTQSSKKLRSYLNNSTMNSSNIIKQSDTAETVKMHLNKVKNPALASFNCINFNIREIAKKKSKKSSSSLLGRSMSLANNLLNLQTSLSPNIQNGPFTKKRSLNLSLKEKIDIGCRQKLNTSTKGLRYASLHENSANPNNIEGSVNKKKILAISHSQNLRRQQPESISSDDANLELITQKMTSVLDKLNFFFKQHTDLKSHLAKTELKSGLISEQLRLAQ